MEISNPQHQIMGSHQLEELLGTSCPKISTANDHHHHQQHMHQDNNNNNNQGGGGVGGERKERPQPDQAIKCPRCDSTNTKFCYYNNYSLSQPRYFCKGCRRYWTQGGTLRNVPVGGGCRKNKRSSSSSNKNNNNKSSNPNPSQPLVPPLSYDPSPPFLLGTSSNPNPAGFLDILRAGFQDHHSAAANSIPTSGFNSAGHGLYSYGVDGGLLPLDGVPGMCTSSAAAAAATTTSTAARSVDEGSESKVMMMGHQWQFGNNEGTNVDYNWNNGSGSYWHGVINSSLM